MTDSRVKNMRSLQTRLWDSLIVFSVLFVCFIASISSGLVSAGVQTSALLQSQGTVEYDPSTSNGSLKFSTSWEDLTTVPKGSFSTINTVTGRPVSMYFGWGGDSSSTYNYGWIDPNQYNRLAPLGGSPHSGTKCLGLQTQSTKRIETIIDNAALNSLGLANQFYFSCWFYLSPNFDMNPLTWVGIFQPWAYGGWCFQQVTLEYQGRADRGNPTLDHFTVELVCATPSNHNFAPATVNGVLVARGTWHHLEVFQTISTSNGRHICWIDGVKLWDVSGFRTTNGSGYHIEFARIYHDTSTKLLQLWVDDVEFWDDIP